MGKLVRRTVAMAVLAGMAVVSSAEVRAGGSASAMVIESHVGERPESAETTVGVVVGALAREGYLVGPGGAGAAYESRVSRPGMAVDTAWIDRFPQEVEIGYGLWLRGAFDDVISTIEPLLAQAEASPGAFVGNDDLKEARLKAMIALAMSRQRVGEKKPATETWTDIVRSYPLTAPDRSTFGPEIAKTHEEAIGRVAKLGTGTLTVEVDDPRAIVYVNERKLGTGSQQTVALAPGPYRVYVAAPGQRGRLYPVTVTRGKATTVATEPTIDRVVVTGPAWFGFRFDSGESRKNDEVKRALRVAQVLAVDSVVIVGELADERAVYGLSIEVKTGAVRRRGKATLEGDGVADGLAALGAYLAGKEANAPITVLKPIDRSLDNDNAIAGPAHTKSPSRIPAWLSAGAAVASFVTGGVMLSLDGKCTADPVAPAIECARVYDTSIGGYAALGAGAVFTVSSIYFFARGGDKPSNESRGVAAIPLGGGGLAVYARWQM